MRGAIQIGVRAIGLRLGERAGLLERLGSAYADDNNLPAAIETFQKMLVLGDDNAERGYGAMIDTYRENKDWQKATDVAREATQKLPNSRRLKLVYAGQVADMGKPEEGLAQVKALLKGTPDDRARERDAVRGRGRRRRDREALGTHAEPDLLAA